MSNNRLDDQGADRKYFTIVPNIVWALAKDTYDLALWTVVKMIAGEDGECYVGTEDLAAMAMMSTGKLSQCRKRLIEAGLLAGGIRRDPGYTQAVWHLTIPDLWQRNLEVRAATGDKLKDRMAFKADGGSLHLVTASPDESKPAPDETKPSQDKAKPSPGETKKNQKKSQQAEPKKKNQAAAGPSKDEGKESVICPIHDVQMKRKTKDGDVWYSHRLPDGTWCKGESEGTGTSERDDGGHKADLGGYARQFKQGVTR